MLILRLLLDFGLVVLIWLVQLVVYPGFRFYSSANLQQWHKSYTTRIAVVVVPLMLGQLIVSTWQLWKEQSLYTSGSWVLVIISWLLTFSIFVPLHNLIITNPNNKDVLKKLEVKNWYRTIVWTLILLWSVFHYNQL